MVSITSRGAGSCRVHPQLLSFLALVLLTGCFAFHHPKSNQQNEGDILVQIWASDECPSSGQTITVRATATNTGNKPFAVELSNEPVLDIVIGRAESGRRWSAGQPLTRDLRQIELQPRESKSIEMTFVPDLHTDDDLIWAQFIYSPRFAETPTRTGIVLRGSCHDFFP